MAERSEGSSGSYIITAQANAIPVLSHYREHPDDEYLLRVGYGGMMGALSNIDQEGFASVRFTHSVHTEMVLTRVTMDQTSSVMHSMSPLTLSIILNSAGSLLAETSA